MFILNEKEIKKRQEEIRDAYLVDLDENLNSYQEFFQLIFPNGEITVNGNKESGVNAIQDKIKEIREWIMLVFETTLQVSQESESETPAFDPVAIPTETSKKIIKGVLKVLSCGKNLTDNALYFISDISQTMNIEVAIVTRIIDQIESEIRQSFFNHLLSNLSDDQCFQCAILIYKAIYADNQVHPAEYKYIKNVLQLLKYDSARLEKVKEVSKTTMPINSLRINEKLTCHLFKTIIEIVLCDQDFDARESKFVQEMGSALGYDKDSLDQILQPIAASMMVKDSLFPRLAI